MIRTIPWHEVPHSIRRAGSTVLIAAALLVVVGLAALFAAAAALRLAERGGL